MVSFTGSTRAGIAVAKAGADTVKRVHQELGGKSPLVVLDEQILEAAVRWGVADCFSNSGQSCNAPTRMLVPARLHDRAVALARAVADGMVVGDPRDPATQLGPVVSQLQFDKIQRLIRAGIEEGATLVTGGEGRPAGTEAGLLRPPDDLRRRAQRHDRSPGRRSSARCSRSSPTTPRPTPSASPTTRPTAWRPTSGPRDLAVARRVAGRIRAGMVHLNGADMALNAPFGGFKQSGNGREWGEFGLADFVELKVVLGYDAGVGAASAAIRAYGSSVAAEAAPTAAAGSRTQRDRIQDPALRSRAGRGRGSRRRRACGPAPPRPRRCASPGSPSA